MRVSSAAGKSEQIKTHQRSFYLSLHGQSLDPQNEAIGTKFQHLVVNTSRTPYERSITNIRTPYHWSKHATDSWGTYQSTNNPHPPVITCLCEFHNYANARPIFMQVEACNFSRSKHSPAYADFINMPCLDSCMPNHIIFQK
ncbi:hypothetical protein M9H77_08890 [Catharanthus roseus]|uniref:Uncharacterized protein n=1 Tax=Catharanthus roseus TaxID=4058 RepID=A0ACC0BZ82_CATRO|nr:hypothetical protein M9H77_08890 [Catharanthus roseus]